MEWNLIDKQHDFLKVLEHQGKSFNTIKNYKADLTCFNHFLLEKQQSLKISSFTSTQVQEYAQFLDDKYGSPNSVRRRVQALRLFFDYLLGQNIFLENPLKQMAVSPKVLDLPNPTPFNEVNSIYELLEKRVHETENLAKLVSMRNLIIFHLIYGAALKVSDLANLQFSNILRRDHEYRVLIEHPKRDPYSIPLPKIFGPIFEEYKKLYKQTLKEQDIEIDELLFNANPYKILSGGLSPRGIELFFEEIRSLLKTKVTAKSLRQSCIFKWINFNINETTIKEWLGVTPSYSLEMYTEEFKKDTTGKVFKDFQSEND